QQHQIDDLSRAGPQGLANPDFLGPFLDGEDHDVPNAHDSGDQDQKAHPNADAPKDPGKGTYVLKGFRIVPDIDTRLVLRIHLVAAFNQDLQTVGKIQG